MKRFYLVIPQAEISVRTAAAFMFGYEAVALVSGGRVPTITALCIQHRWLAAAAVLGLVSHLAMYGRGEDRNWEIALAGEQ